VAKRGRKFTFHGAYGTKARAQRKEARVRGAFIRVTTIRGRRRYLVLTRRS